MKFVIEPDVIFRRVNIFVLVGWGVFSRDGVSIWNGGGVSIESCVVSSIARRRSRWWNASR